jgi:serine/threonine protein kinase
LADFGSAQLRVGDGTSVTHNAQGNAAYMSPEQLNGEALDDRADLFSVGVILWEMITGTSLFQRETIEATTCSVLTGTIPRPGNIRPVPVHLESIVMRLLERTRTNRYSSAVAARDALLACYDTPTNGRSSLQQILLERFPLQAPTRRSPSSLTRKTTRPHLSVETSYLSVPRRSHAFTSVQRWMRNLWIRSLFSRIAWFTVAILSGLGVVAKSTY